MKRIFLMMVSIIALAAVYAVPVAADEQTPSELQVWGESSVCDLTKVNTRSQQFADSDHSPVFETLSFGNPAAWQHFEPHTAPGVNTVSWVLPPMEVATAHDIFGVSIWEGPCGPEGYDYVPDAAQYSIDRMDDGHSGIVVVVPGTGEACTVIDTTLSAGTVVTQQRLDFISLLLSDQVRHMSVSLCPNLSVDNWDLNLVGWGS